LTGFRFYSGATALDFHRIPWRPKSQYKLYTKGKNKKGFFLISDFGLRIEKQIRFNQSTIRDPKSKIQNK